MNLLPRSRNVTRRAFARSVIIAPAAFGLAGCVSAADMPPLPAPADQAYHLGPGDQIRIITYDEPQLTNTFTVGDDGNIAVPLIGNVQAAGLTPDQFGAAVSDALSRSKLFNAPSVSVEVAVYRPISVLGEVTHPGQYPYQPGMTTLDAVALAGGFTYRAVTDYASAWRTSGLPPGQSVQGKIGPGTVLEPGDVVTIYERYF